VKKISKNRTKRVSALIFQISALLTALIFLSVACNQPLVTPSNIEDPKTTNETSTPFHPSTMTNTSTVTPTFTPTPTITSTPTITPTPTPYMNEWIEQEIQEMTPEEKIGQMIMTGVYGQAWSSQTCQFIQQLKPGAVVYQGFNAVTPTQLRDFSAGLQGCAEYAPGIPLFIAIDHEGQYVDRFDYGSTILPSAMAQGATQNLEVPYQLALASGQELAYSGVNVVLGPDADVLADVDNRVISVRSFGGDTEYVATLVARAVEGYREAGVIPVLKHFPGHGGVAADSHYALPRDEVSLTDLQSGYLPPFMGGIQAGAPVVMTSHVAFPSIDGTLLPATLSNSIIQLLREELSFQGIVLTDSMGMGAISASGYSLTGASEEAIRAGVDMLLITSPDLALLVRNHLVLIVNQGGITQERIDESVRRILRIKANYGLHSFPLDETSEPDWAAHESIAFDSGYQAVALVHDEGNLIPISEEIQRILVVGPADGWGLYPVLNTALREAGFSFEELIYSGPWRGPVPDVGYLTYIPNQAQYYDLILMLTWDAHLNYVRYGDRWQVNLVNSLISGDTPVIVVALKSPTDIVEFPQVSTYVCTFGTTQGQIQAVADVLVGKLSPMGSLPLPNLLQR
jgi:beta-N-acetylhexosaminidase